MAKQTRPAAWRVTAVLLVLGLFGGGVLAWRLLLPKLQRTALIAAAKQGNLGTVRRLLAQGVDVNAPPPGQRALDYAILSGRPSVVVALLDHGAVVDPAGAFETAPLVEAVDYRQPQIVKILLAQGANANRGDPNGLLTLLNLAFAGREAATMEALLQAGADPNMTDRRKGTTALMWSARGGELAMVQALVAHGANVNARDRQAGETVLMWAVRGAHLPVIRYLVEHGAQVNARNIGNHGAYTALMVANESVRILERQRDRGFASARAGLDQYVKDEQKIVQFLKHAAAAG